jgi:hypothetical protein
MLEIRPLAENDPPVIAAAFEAIGWRKPVEQYRRYLLEQSAGVRTVLVARLDGDFAGYVTIVWSPAYAALRDAGIPEISDFNVLLPFVGAVSVRRSWTPPRPLSASGATQPGSGLASIRTTGRRSSSMCCAAISRTDVAWFGEAEAPSRARVSASTATWRSISPAS